MEIRALIVGKMDNLKKDFDKSNEQVREKTELVNSTQKEIAMIVDSQKSMQGEYKALLEIGTELGILNQDGSEIPDASSTSQPVPTVPVEVVNNDNGSQA